MPHPAVPPGELAAFRRFLFILYFTLLGSVGLYWVVLEMVAVNVEPRAPGLEKTLLPAIAAGCGVVVLCLRFARIAPLLAEASGDFGQRLARLRFHYTLCYTLSETVALYGFVVRMLGGAREEAAPFFLGAAGLFLLCYPRVPQAPGSRTG